MPVPKDGFVVPSDTPGFGLEIDAQWIMPRRPEDELRRGLAVVEDAPGWDWCQRASTCSTSSAPAAFASFSSTTFAPGRSAVGRAWTPSPGVNPDRPPPGLHAAERTLKTPAA